MTYSLINSSFSSSSSSSSDPSPLLNSNDSSSFSIASSLPQSSVILDKILEVIVAQCFDPNQTDPILIERAIKQIISEGHRELFFETAQKVPALIEFLSSLDTPPCSTATIVNDSLSLFNQLSELLKEKDCQIIQIGELFHNTFDLSLLFGAQFNDEEHENSKFLTHVFENLTTHTQISNAYHFLGHVEAIQNITLIFPFLTLISKYNEKTPSQIKNIKKKPFATSQLLKITQEIISHLKETFKNLNSVESASSRANFSHYPQRMQVISPRLIQKNRISIEETIKKTVDIDLKFAEELFDAIPYLQLDENLENSVTSLSNWQWSLKLTYFICSKSSTKTIFSKLDALHATAKPEELDFVLKTMLECSIILHFANQSMISQRLQEKKPKKSKNKSKIQSEVKIFTIDEVEKKIAEISCPYFSKVIYYLIKQKNDGKMVSRAFFEQFQQSQSSTNSFEHNLSTFFPKIPSEEIALSYSNLITYLFINKKQRNAFSFFEFIKNQKPANANEIFVEICQNLVKLEKIDFALQFGNSICEQRKLENALPICYLVIFSSLPFKDENINKVVTHFEQISDSLKFNVLLNLTQHLSSPKDSVNLALSKFLDSIKTNPFFIDYSNRNKLNHANLLLTAFIKNFQETQDFFLKQFPKPERAELLNYFLINIHSFRDSVPLLQLNSIEAGLIVKFASDLNIKSFYILRSFFKCFNPDPQLAFGLIDEVWRMDKNIQLDRIAESILKCCLFMHFASEHATISDEEIERLYCQLLNQYFPQVIYLMAKYSSIDGKNISAHFFEILQRSLASDQQKIAGIDEFSKTISQSDKEVIYPYLITYFFLTEENEKVKQLLPNEINDSFYREQIDSNTSAPIYNYKEIFYTIFENLKKINLVKAKQFANFFL